MSNFSEKEYLVGKALAKQGLPDQQIVRQLRKHVEGYKLFAN